MGRMKDVYIGFELVKNYANSMQECLVKVEKGQMDEHDCIANLTELVGKLQALADDVLSVHQQESREAVQGWRAMLREARSRLKKKARDKARWKEQKQALRTYATQLPEPGKPEYNGLLFTNKAIAKMKAIGVTEGDCLDVFKHGTVIKESMMSRKYSGYEIGIVFGRDKKTRQYIIFSAWKRERR